MAKKLLKKLVIFALGAGRVGLFPALSPVSGLILPPVSVDAAMLEFHNDTGVNGDSAPLQRLHRVDVNSLDVREIGHELGKPEEVFGQCVHVYRIFTAHPAQDP